MLHCLKPNLTSSMREREREVRERVLLLLFDLNSHKNTPKATKMSLNPDILII